MLEKWRYKTFYEMVKNVIKGSFTMSKVLVFEGNSYVCWKNEVYYFMIANGKQCD